MIEPEASLTLVVRRTIRATPERLFNAWTEPEHLRKWWGPAEVECPGAEVDLRVGGAYRIGNRLPTGDVIWIRGEFQLIERPTKLIYTWGIEPADASERVTVRFEASADATEVIVAHERIVGAEKRTEHQRGWIGCLDGLKALVES